MNKYKLFVSIIMPIRNEDEHIECSLDSVLAQDYPAEQVEVILVDGMSDDETRSIIRTISSRNPTRRIKILDNPKQIVPVAFNLGLMQATGEIIVRVDGHCLLAPDYISRCVESLMITGADNVGGLQRAAGTNLVGSAIAHATSSPFGVGGSRFHYATTPGWADTVYLGAYRRDVFDRIGGFDEELVRNQDDEFNFRLIQSGGKIWLDPQIRSTYFSRSSFSRLWKQYYQYGFYKVRVIQKRGAVAALRHLVPAGFVGSLLLSVLLAIGTRRWRWLWPVVVPYIFANSLASVLAARKCWRLLPLLPAAFGILHCAYGLGFLMGLWAWRKHWTEMPLIQSLET